MDEQEDTLRAPAPPITDAYLHRDVHPDVKSQHGQSSYDSVLHPKQGHVEDTPDDVHKYWEYC